MYRFLSVALRPPGEDLTSIATDETSSRALQAAVGGSGQEITAALRPVIQALTEADAEALGDEYVSVFGHQVGVDCPLYETQYAGGGVFQQAQRIADIAGFYRAFGLDVGDEARERPDHISLELEFMHVLAYREAYARTHHGPAELELLVDAQRAFLRDHLARWVPAFSRLVARKNREPYGALAMLLMRWIAVDANALEVGPVEEADLLPAAEGSDLEDVAPACGAARCPLEVSA